MENCSPSIVEYFSKHNKEFCNYCSTSEGSSSYGLHGHILTVDDYQNMIDRGWRRSGHYCYKAIMDQSCCPLYTIRCAAKDFRLSKTQKKIIKRFNSFLCTGVTPKDKIFINTDVRQQIEVNDKAVKSKTADKSKVVIQSSVGKVLSEKDLVPIKKEIIQNKALMINEKDFRSKKPPKNKIMKAKYLRIERKRQKLLKLGLTEEEMAKKLVEKKKYPVTKTLEDYLDETSSKNKVHNLKISLVRSCPRSEEFNKTFSVSFDLYKRFQIEVLKDRPQKLTERQFERFLVKSPLQIQVVSVKSPEFKNTFNESASLFAKYQKNIHGESEAECDKKIFKAFLVDSPLEPSKEYGSYHQQYWLDDKLIAVGVIDVLPKCVSSVYFFYDPDYTYLSLGTYGALREIEFTRKLSNGYPNLIYYYMGFYIHSCVKMKYKGGFKPSYLLCPEVFSWHILDDCLPKLNASKYCRFNDDSLANDINSDPSPSDVLILYNKIAMPFPFFLKQKKCKQQEIEEIMEYARLVGKLCVKNMLLYRE